VKVEMKKGIEKRMRQARVGRLEEERKQDSKLKKTRMEIPVLN
jgi:hypothetical protein